MILLQLRNIRWRQLHWHLDSYVHLLVIIVGVSQSEPQIPESFPLDSLTPLAHPSFFLNPHGLNMYQLIALILIIVCTYASASCAYENSGVQGGTYVTYDNAEADKSDHSIPQLAIAVTIVPVAGAVFTVFIWPHVKAVLKAGKLAKAAKAAKVAKATE